MTISTVNDWPAGERYPTRCYACHRAGFTTGEYFGQLDLIGMYKLTYCPWCRKKLGKSKLRAKWHRKD